MQGKTISITIPEQLEKELQKEANRLGISRSRHIGNILLKWSEDRYHRNKLTTNCVIQERQQY